MKENYEEHIRKALNEIQDITSGLLPHGKYKQVVNRCGEIVYLMNKQKRNAAKGNDYPEIPFPEFDGDEVREAEEKKAYDRERILEALADGGTLTTVQAIGMGILRCGARVFELRKKGYPVATRLIRSGKSRIAEYYLETNQQ